MSYTYVLMPVSEQTFNEVKKMMEAADYRHAFDTHDGKPTIDMHGIALIQDDGKMFHIGRYQEGDKNELVKA